MKTSHDELHDLSYRLTLSPLLYPLFHDQIVIIVGKQNKTKRNVKNSALHDRNETKSGSEQWAAKNQINSFFYMRNSETETDMKGDGEIL